MNKVFSLNQENILLKIGTYYSGHNYLLGFNNADLNFEGVISILNNPENIEIAPKSIFEISNFNLRVEDSNLDLNGQIENYSDKLPRGKFFVNLNNYPKFIDKLVHQNFIISKST